MNYKPNIFDQERVQFNLVKYYKYGKNFEIVVDPDLVIAYKNKKAKTVEDIRELLKAEKVFFDAKKGDLASEDEIKSVFGTNDTLKVAEIMIEKGDIQLTSEYREKLRQDKKKQIINYIHRSAVNPKTGAPHPVNRIENALEEARVKIDEMKKAEDQVQDVLSKLKPIIPIKFDKKTLSIKLPLQYAAKLHGFITGYGKVESEAWLSDGSYTCRITIPAGLQNELFDELNSRTHGKVDISVEK